jgi:hypothetical protein
MWIGGGVVRGVGVAVRCVVSDGVAVVLIRTGLVCIQPQRSRRRFFLPAMGKSPPNTCTSADASTGALDTS